jgi:hypothetical protein
LAPDFRIGDISKRYPIDPNYEVPARASQDYNLVGSILRDTVKSIDNVSVILRSKSHRSTVTVELDDKNSIGVSCHSHAGVGCQIGISNCGHKIFSSMNGLELSSGRSHFAACMTRSTALCLATVKPNQRSRFWFLRSGEVVGFRECFRARQPSRLAVL